MSTPVNSPNLDPTVPVDHTEPAPNAVEQVVLVDGEGRPIGVADKATVHGPRTPRHLAFSCYGFDGNGRLLVSQRSRDKLTFPGVWTNTCCGHPAPGESPAAAATRRMRFELGLEPQDLRVVLPDFSYRASDGRVEENELCPVFVCGISGDVRARADEVDAVAWWSWQRFLDAAADPASGLSPWAREQAPLLDKALFRTSRPARGPRFGRGSSSTARTNVPVMGSE